MNSRISLAGRALLAVVLMIGFYLLALAIAGGLLYIPYAELVYAERLHIKLALVCVVGGLAILWSVIPRRDKFEPPGPELKSSEHPALFAELEGVANSVKQSMPAEVYLVPDVNAWVTQRGGIMGFGSRRVMGLGLPLMRMLSRSQFRAVLAHEFGHYHGGDTKLGPWIYKTRGAIGRTLASLGDGSWLQLPFLWYGKVFLRITHAVSRHQEFVADELAARAVGSDALIGGLRTIHGIAPAFNAFWFQECAPALSAGYRPPLADGFNQFVQAGPVVEAMSRHLEEELKTGKANPYDTHPPLKERLAAVEHLPAGNAVADDSPASTLLADLEGMERLLVASMVRPDFAEKLKPVEWHEVSSLVHLPEWKKLVRTNNEALTGLVPESLSRLTGDLERFGMRLRTINGDPPGNEQGGALAAAVVGAVLALLLVDRGGRLSAMPGQTVTVTLASATCEPFEVMRALASGKLTIENWQRLCGELGINGVDLGTVVKPVEAGS